MNKDTASRLIFCLGALVFGGNASALSTFNIGNSLTWDSNPYGTTALAQSAGIPVNVGFHVASGRPLDYIVAHPSDVTIVSSYGTFDNALANNAWDNVTIQPYQGVGSTLGTDLAAFGQLISMTNAGPSTNTNFYLYAGWPGIPSGIYPALPSDAYSTGWGTASANQLDTPSSQSAQYFNNLYSRLTENNPTEAIYLIPVGQTLSMLAEEIAAGHLAGFDNIYDFYRDPLHLNTDVGRYIAAATTFSTLYGRSAAGLSVPLTYFGLDGAESILATDSLLRDQLANIAWGVVSSDPRTGQAIAPVPLPAAAYLLFSGICATVALGRRKDLAAKFQAGLASADAKMLPTVVRVPG